MSTKITLMRRTSQGIAGTFQNIDCHAERLRSIVTAVANAIPKLEFAEWVQGHNIHTVRTGDGRVFAFRPFSRRGEGYIGLSLYSRVSRSNEILLATLYTDARNGLDIHGFLNILRSLAEVREEHENVSKEESAAVERQLKTVRYPALSASLIP